MRPPFRDRSRKHAGRGRPGSIGTHRRPTLEMACFQAAPWVYEMTSSLCLAVTTITFCLPLVAFAQEITLTPKPGVTTEEVILTHEEVIVTGSNIPTAEEVGPQPVDTYHKDDIARLGVRSALILFRSCPWLLARRSMRI